MSLREYRKKRDFRKTREPSGVEPKASGSAPRFVIQKHDASRLHYDFRLEVDGVLKSWAVPKGLPATTGEKRLAVQVEDHPLEYGDFEGIIPSGEYGGGTVMLWDLGTYEAEGAAAGIGRGKLHFVLHGKKLEGEWALIRLAKGEKGNEWLIFKAGKDARAVSKKRDNQSAKSGRTMKQIAADKTAVWSSDDATDEATPAFVKPMLARLVERPPTAAEWIYELKFDGYRALAVRNGNSLALWSRNEKPLHFPGILDGLRELPVEQFTIDGEIVALDDEGRPSFQRLQRRDEEPATLVFYAFDLLNLEGRDLRARKLERRRELLEKLIDSSTSKMLRYSAALKGRGPDVLAGVQEMQLEGIIAKRRGSVYESGRRTGAWRKVKCLHEQEFLIGGFTDPGGSRKYFGALLLGYYEKGDLQFAGKVGTGFSQKTLRSIHRQLEPRIRKTTPFVDQVRMKELLSASNRKRCHWVTPQLVAQVRFTEWTSEGALRHPVFLGLREDKDASAVVREDV